jgi:hypothetical protein
VTRLLLAIAWTAAALAAADVQPVPPSDLTIHEWGTFTSVAGEDGSAVSWDALGGKDDLPAFVASFGYRCFKRAITDTVRMETPVMYFYSPRDLDAQVKVAFPRGVITEWYPQAQHLDRGIEWQNIKVEPNTSPALPTETAPSRYYAARGTDRAQIAVGDQHEKFLFYRGVGDFQVPLSARVGANGTIAIENSGAEPVPTVILFENRGGRLGYRNAGEVKDAVMLDSPSLDSSLPVLRTELETALIAQGLYPKEAQAMVETWRDSWFEEGTRLIYIVPSHAVDAFLPLQVDPAPSQTARVFVGRIELITPEIMRSVENAMASGDSPAIKRYGRFVNSILNRIVSENPSMEHQIAQVRAKIWSSTDAGACRQAPSADAHAHPGALGETLSHP